MADDTQRNSPSRRGRRLSWRLIPLAVVAAVLLGFGAQAVRRFLEHLPRRPDAAALPDPHPSDQQDATVYFDEITDTSGIGLRTPLPPFRDRFADWTIGGGVAIDDFDGDGRPDVYVTSTSGPNALYLNRGSGHFEDVAASWGAALPDAWSLGATAADYHDDGRPDLLVATRGGLVLLHNEGGRFADATAGSGFASPNRNAGIAVADYDGDGHLDAFVPNWLEIHDGRPAGWPLSSTIHGRLPHRLFHNQGNGTFRDVSDLLPTDLRTSASFAAVWSDFDADGRPDLYVINDFGYDTAPNQLYRNDGPGDDGRWRFTPVGDECGCRLGISGMGAAVADFDGDGRQDLYLSNILNHLKGGEDGERLLRNLGALTFQDITERAHARAATVASRRVISWGPEALDVDNDGWPDIYVPFGHFPPNETPDVPKQPNALLLNDHGRSFRLASRSGAEDEGWSRGVGVVDLDLDGCLDLVVANLGGRTRAYRNRCMWGNHWVGVRLVGTRSNRDAVGAVVRLTAGGATQRGEVFAGSTSVHSSRWKTVHFGLGSSASIDRLEVAWPSGLTEVFPSVPVDRYSTLVEGTGSAVERLDNGEHPR